MLVECGGLLMEQCGLSVVLAKINRNTTGHKKQHGFQYQSIMTPDGLMSSLHGPNTGPTGDWAKWNDSGLDLKLRGIISLQSRYCLYGDLAYWPAFGIMGPHRQQDVAVPLSRAKSLPIW